MTPLGALLAYGRETMMVAALAGLIVAGVVVAMGAFFLVTRERRSAPLPHESGPEHPQRDPRQR